MRWGEKPKKSVRLRHNALIKNPDKKMLYEKLQKVLTALQAGEFIEGTNKLWKLGSIHLTKGDINFLTTAGLLTRIPSTEKWTVKLGPTDKCKEIDPQT